MPHGLMECPVCGSKSMRLAANLGKAKLKECRKCRVIANEYKVSSCREGEYYREQYERLYNNYYRKFRERQFENFFKNVKEIDFKGKRVLDIGCSYGMFLKRAKEFGCVPVGVEPSPKAFEAVSSDSKIEVYDYDMASVSKVPGTFDLITLWNVFEHLENPASALSIIHSKLNKDGVLLLCVPNLRGLITQISFFIHWASLGLAKQHLVKLYQLDNDFPHFFHYSRRSLKKLLRKHKFAPFFYSGHEIVDEKHLKERVMDYVGNKKINKKIIVFLLRRLLRLSRLLKREDEIIIMARKA